MFKNLASVIVTCFLFSTATGQYHYPSHYGDRPLNSHGDPHVRSHYGNSYDVLTDHGQIGHATGSYIPGYTVPFHGYNSDENNDGVPDALDLNRDGRPDEQEAYFRSPKLPRIKEAAPEYIRGYYHGKAKSSADHDRGGVLHRSSPRHISSFGFNSHHSTRGAKRAAMGYYGLYGYRDERGRGYLPLSVEAKLVQVHGYPDDENNDGVPDQLDLNRDGKIDYVQHLHHFRAQEPRVRRIHTREPTYHLRMRGHHFTRGVAHAHTAISRYEYVPQPKLV